MMKAIIVDDHEVVRQGLKQIIESSGEIEVVHEISSGNEAVNHFSPAGGFDPSEPSPIVLMDITMPDRSGPSVMKHALAHFPDLKVIFVSMHEESQFAINLIKSGAKGYVSKTADREVFLTAFKKVSEGKCYFSDDIAQLLLAGAGAAKESSGSQLTPRETELMLLLSEGLTTKEIAERINIGQKTVTVHRDNIKKKLNIETNAQLIKYAVQNYGKDVSMIA